MRTEVGGEHTLSELLEPLRSEYDWIVIDTSPYLGLLTINALAACHEVIIPVSPQLWSATGLTDLLQTVFKGKLNKDSIYRVLTGETPQKYSRLSKKLWKCILNGRKIIYMIRLKKNQKRDII